jgi:hypothetical protein
MLRGGNVFDDEYFFAGLDEPQFAPCHLFDRGRILAQPPRLVAEPRVFRALARERRGERGIPAADAQHRQQSPVAGERVEDDGEGDENEADVQEAPVTRAAAQRLRVTADGLRGDGRRHFRTKYNKRMESTTQRFKRFKRFKRF